MPNNTIKIYGDARFKTRSDYLENWQSQNPILLQGEPSYVIDGKSGQNLKYGDGVTPWNNLPYLSEGGTDEEYELIETVSVTEEAVVQRTYDKYYKKILVWAQSDAKLPRFRLINSERGLFWEFYSYAANTYTYLKLYGESEVKLSGNAIFNVQAIVGDGGSNPKQCLPVTERLGPLAVYNYGFNGFKTDSACKVGTSIKIYGVEA